MEKTYPSHFQFEQGLSLQGQVPIQYQTQHTQSLLTAPADPVTMVQGHYQPPNMKTHNVELSAQAGHSEDATRIFMVPYQQMTAADVRPDDMIRAESRGTMAGTQGPPHFVNVTSFTAVPENLMHGMVPPSGIYSGLGENAGTGFVADTNTQGPRASSSPTLQTQLHVNMVCAFSPGAQPLAATPQHVLPHNSGIGQRQQSIPREDTQALIADGSVFGANRTEVPITPGASDGIASDRWTGILQYQREGAWFQVQAVAADGVRNPMFSILPRILQIQIQVVETAVSSLDVQGWILKTRTPVARIKGRSGDSHQFDDLVKLVRSGSYALAGWEMRRPRLLLVSLNEDLLCAFPPSGITSLPMPQPQQPVRKKRRVSSSSRGCSRPGSRHKAVGALTPKQRLNPKAVRNAPTLQQAAPHLWAQLRALCHTGDPRTRFPHTGKAIPSPPRPEAQRSQRAASLSMLGSGGGVDDGSRTDPVATGSVTVATSSDGLGSTPLVEGNGGPLLDIGENRATRADADISIFGDANMTHIPGSSLEVEEDFDMAAWINL